MSNLNNILKENYELKAELEELVRTVKENEAKHQGFKTVQYSCLLSESLVEFSAKPLKYLEDIFNLDKALLFIREGCYAVASGCVKAGERVFVKSGEAFDYTFLEKRLYFGSNSLMLHQSFRFPDAGDDYSFVLAPVTDRGGITAAIGLYSSDKERFGKDRNFDFITELALMMSIALRKLNDSYMLEMQAQTDYLTGLPNKSMMEISAERWLERYRDYKKPFAFVLLDLDNFKQINDASGHLIGDDVLRRAARAVRNAIGGGDLLGRFGGDEFYMFVETDDMERLAVMENNILKAIGSISDNMGIAVKLGISGGGIRIPEDLERAETFMELVKLADERLYAVKKAGGDGFRGVTDDYRQKRPQA